MIKRNNVAKIIISGIIALFCWTFTCINTELFTTYTDREIFRLGPFIISLVASAAICALGTVKVSLSGHAQKIAGALVYIISIFGAMEISVLFSDGFNASAGVYFINILFYLVFAGLGLLISGSMRVSALTALGVSYAFNCASFIVYCLRGSSLTPTDFYAFRTAMNVAENYEFELKYQMITATTAAAAFMMLAFKFPMKLKFRARHAVMRLAGAAVTAAAVMFVATYDFSPYDVSVFDQYFANLTYGSAFSFYVNGSKLGLEPKEPYEPDKLETMLLSYGDEDTAEINPEDKPNIIVIMNESFADLSVINEFDTNEEYMPFISSLERNTIKGQLLVSPFGGYTCNTEYEFLTGMSTGVLGSRAAPYIQMMFSKMPYSLNTHLSSLGYNTTAMHPYYASGWNRTRVYDYLSFDRFISLENFREVSEYPEYVRGYISDRSSYTAVMNLLYEKEPEDREFIFNITMQNHGGYTDDAFESEIFLQDMSRTYPETEQYLTLIKESDSALEYLLDMLEDYDEPTIVMMFGDHMPNIERGFYEELYGSTLEELDADQAQRRYMVPFILWANYDIEEDDTVHTSPCYLSNLLMETAGLPKSRVQLYLDELSMEMPQLNPMGYYDLGGYWHSFQESEMFGDYYNLQYALLTGERLSYDFEYGEKEYEFFGNFALSPQFTGYGGIHLNGGDEQADHSEEPVPTGSPRPERETAPPTASPENTREPEADPAPAAAAVPEASASVREKLGQRWQ